MKDLYRNIGLYQQVDDPNTLESSIAHCRDRAAAAAARHILLNPAWKSVYDRNHRLLATIGQLRARLALPPSDSWEELGNQDFDWRSPEVQPLPISRDPMDDVPVARPSMQRPRNVRFRQLGRSHLVTPMILGLKLGVAATALIVAGWLVYHFLPMSRLASLLSTGDAAQKASDSAAAGDERKLGTSVAVSHNRLPFGADAEPTSNPDRAPAHLPQPLPVNGSVTRFDSSRARVPINFVAQHDKVHYFVTLTDTNTGRDVLSVFVRGGQTAELRIPPGRYRLRYAMGTTWYGPRHLFGEQTEHARAAEELDCRATSNSITVYTVQLRYHAAADGFRP